jgi:acetyltransferase-like isoleucine patch superfamily enzyme
MAGSKIPKIQDQLFSPGTSSRDKYASLVVGRPGLVALLKYELVVTLAQARAGAVGLVLRKQLYPWLLGSCGRDVVFGQNVVLRHPHKIHIGSNVVIDDNCLLDAKGESNQGIRVGDNVFVGRNSILSCKNGDIELKAGANIGFNCEVFSASRVTIGAGVLMAAYAYIIGGDHDFSDPTKPVLDQSRTSSGVTIGDGAWLGAGAKVLDGVSVGSRAVVGAGAVVRDDVPDGAVAVGVPARLVTPRETGR